ncbi:MAG TPA: DNA methyltransferase [Ktedonobacterales bacterium]|nr:DNA methyltransferase [Ktedonobacterales bacterium]
MKATDDYAAFLASKRVTVAPCGFAIEKSALHIALFPWQAEIVRWALQRGRAALFEETGLGKTPQQLEWARHVAERTGKPVLIFAPLAVAEQTRDIGRDLLGLDVTICRSQTDVQPGVNITNYEMLRHFDSAAFGGVVIDEASILKSYDGKTRKALNAFGRSIPYRLVATATPAPNETIELINYAEFLDVMNGKEILALFFTQDGNSTHEWRLKGHAHSDFYRWLASWAIAIRKPSDIGYRDDGFNLPPLTIEQHVVEAKPMAGHLFAIEAKTLSERGRARKASVADRVKVCADLVNGSDESWLVWCNLNSESTALAKAIPGAVEVTGSDPSERKAQAMLDFAAGRIRVMVSKPSICGFGLNFQVCHNVAFVGLSDSWEQYHQAIRRCWRFKQAQPVHAHVITSEVEGAVVANIEHKERQAAELMESLVREVAQHTLLTTAGATREEVEYEEAQADGRDWTLYLGDSVHMLEAVEPNSVGLTVTSVPFPGMYAYTNTPHDIGNTRNQEEMLAHFRFLARKLLRVTMPGRMCCIHLTQSPVFKSADGYVGLRDFRGDTIKLMESEGWHYYGEVTISKDPQVKAQRTKERGLMFRTLATDSSLMRMALADYLLYFMKPGINPQPIRAGRSEKYGNPNGWITNDEWIEWARPVWLSSAEVPGGIRETNVLNVRTARESDDERHLCPLQLDVIERAIKLWSAPGDLVLDPFAGIGSVGVVALQHQRSFIGIELKRSYWQTAQQNLRDAERAARTPSLWDGLLDMTEMEAPYASVASAS